MYCPGPNTAPLLVRSTPGFLITRQPCLLAVFCSLDIPLRPCGHQSTFPESHLHNLCLHGPQKTKKGSSEVMGHGSHRPSPGKVTLEAVIAAGFIWFLLFMADVVDAADGGSRASIPSPSLLKNGQSSEGEVKAKLAARPESESDVNYMSKRRVPSGPDPIHNW